MSFERARRVLAAVLVVFVVIAVVFYLRQNQGLQSGGSISPPKMVWLAYAMIAWFLVPPFLWRDVRLAVSVRRLFGAFWAVMLVRGVLEGVLVYGFGHWTPWYGIGHDLFSLVLLLWLRRGIGACCPGDHCANHWALRFAGAVAISLVAETVFASVFLTSGAAARGIYFVSSDPQWTLVNLVTTLVLVFLVPDLLATLIGLYFPGTRRTTPRLMATLRALVGGLVVAVLVAFLGLWSWMTGVERQAREFQQAGYQVVDSCAQLKDDFLASTPAGIGRFTNGAAVRWRTLPADRQVPFAMRGWADDGEPRDLAQALVDWRQSFAQVDQAAFKIHLVDAVARDQVTAQLRFEVTGVDGERPLRRTDSGLLRCRFQRDPLQDGRWVVTEAGLIEGLTVAGSGTLLRDVAAARGLDFCMEPDDRFVPCMECTGHPCFGPTELRFQTMRHAYAGCAAGDLDGDGHDDLFLCAGGRSSLYRNRGDGSFENWTTRAGLPELWHVNTAGFADLDQDGDQDLFLGRFFGPNLLYENLGAGTFRERPLPPAMAAVDHVTCFAFFDHDGDGDLDLYLGRFLDAAREIPGSFLYARNGQPNRLYRNDGELMFTDVTEAAGVGDLGLTLSLAAADYDEDGDQDLYVANDFGRNALYQNQGDGTFLDVALATGTLAIGGSMSASWGDYDNDGRLDLYVAAIRSNQRWFVQPVTARRVVLKFLREGRLGSTNPLLSDLQQFLGDDWLNIGNHALAGNSLLRQQPDGTFSDEAERAGARPAGWYWSAGFLDLDHDGDLDIFATDGWITGKRLHDL